MASDPFPLLFCPLSFLFWLWVAFWGGDRYMEDSWLGDVFFCRYQNVGPIDAEGWRLIAWLNLTITGILVIFVWRR
ncbi:MAG: hypothetical protein ACREJQ_06700 [bacterium]